MGHGEMGMRQNSSELRVMSKQVSKSVLSTQHSALLRGMGYWLFPLILLGFPVLPIPNP